MLSDFLKAHITSQAKYVDYGYGQVEPNHLSARYTGQIYAQLPADPEIKVLEQGQFAKYDYANGLVNFTGNGEWMLVYNEIKLYREHQEDCEFAMLKDNYQARIYSPYDPDSQKFGQSRFLNGVDSDGNDSVTVNGKEYKYDDVTAPEDIYELHYNEDPFHFIGAYKPKKMPEGTTMVPRLVKTNVGDIFTTNTIDEEELNLGDILAPNETGILSTSGDTENMQWEVSKIYTMPDGQKGVKIVRIK